jgi:hypothetical protein
MTSRTHTHWLIDKSALVRLGASPDASLWTERIGRGLIRITTVTLLLRAISRRFQHRAT